MAVLTGKLLLILAIYLAKKAAAEFGIVAPFPENIYPIEFTSAKVTCVAFDSENANVMPETIKFMRKDKFTIYRELKPSNTLSFTNRTEENGRKLFVTMHLKNVTLADDSVYGTLGRYECHAYAVGDPVKRQHGFSVNVIRKSEIPQVSVPKLGTLDHGQDVTLTCNMTERGNQFNTLLTRISWYKDGDPLQSVRNPDPTVPDDTIGPLEIKDLKVQDGGTYRCLLEVELRNVKPYNVSQETTINVAPWLDKPKEDLEVKKFKGDEVTFVCVAQGFPLQVEWKLKKKSEDRIQSCINSSTDNRYLIRRSQSTHPLFKPYELTIRDLDYTDRGMYYCCLPTQCSDDVETDCQRFILRIRDPLGPLWPIIGILVEAILLFLIIFLAEKRKQKKERAEREDGRIEFSYSSTDDGDRGQVRMRKMAESPMA